MANIYSNMTQKEKDNERAYLTNLQNSGNSGEKEWATNQLKQLNSTTSSTPSYNQTWESGGRTYVGGVDVGPAGTKVDTSTTSGLISSGVASNNKVNTGGMKAEDITYNPYQEEMDNIRQAYADYKNQIEEQNRLAIQQGTQRLEAQKSNINQAAEDNARQAYIMQMQAKKALPQQLAGQGATGGTTETANLGIQTAYQNTLNDINRNKVNSIQEIDNAIADLKTTGDLATVEQVLANNQAMLDSYMNMLDKGVSYNQWANQYNANRADTAYEQGYQERSYQDALKQQAYENELALQKAQTSAKETEEKQEASKNYSNILNNTMGYASSGYYADNMNGAKYLLGELNLGNVNVDEAKNIIKQANIPIETVARTLKKSFGATDAEISDFIIDYYNNQISDDYLAKIINYANAKEYVEPSK